MDASSSADIVATLHGEKKFIVIYSKTSKFVNVPIYQGERTYIAFINSYALDDFVNALQSSNTVQAEQIKMYISIGVIRLVDADNPQGSMN